MQHIPTIPRNLLNVLGESLALARNERGWRQIDLAERVGVSRQTIAKMERGNAHVAVGVYFTAAWLLRVPFIPGIGMDESDADNALASFVRLLKKHSSKRVNTKMEKPVDDNF